MNNPDKGGLLVNAYKWLWDIYDDHRLRNGYVDGQMFWISGIT